ncbi:Ribonuclease P/MRP protein subunit POP5 [Citrus sinensis]|uniref:Ribonuclease P/MRP protein subunit POP5 n=1 Tax=Citrus sinensis TaxID=2711 RepID=A0ACB8M4J6_CITSI|nr:Ribonuclease P/MRP protein subunit POP5 [Citrus sinensis]
MDDPVILTQFNVSKAIRDNILVNFSECGLASLLGSFQVKYVNPITKLCIIKASMEDFQKVWSAITMVRSIGNCLVLFNVLDLSVNSELHLSLCRCENEVTFSFCIIGSIRACKNAALKREEVIFEHYKLAVGARFSADVTQHMDNCLEKIKILEY